MQFLAVISDAEYLKFNLVQTGCLEPSSCRSRPDQSAQISLEVRGDWIIPGLMQVIILGHLSFLVKASVPFFRYWTYETHTLSGKFFSQSPFKSGQS